ncbi:MAG: arsenate reductase (glutaredoxin) [Rhodospirillaceae bacterium]|jgi:arsenate reductase (glutaredoxin)|nr:arsenate reductase (glutaredoxin) [Rhodospirillaceae bacterium]MBT6119087.1 arsenate reductase (glutaredoxin) [Rhodospirillaceae bacterium]
MAVKIYHNPRCSKSRQTLELLRDKGIEPEIVEYLADPPSAAELKRILGMLGKSPREVMRKQEAEYKAAGLNDEGLSEDALIAGMVANPKVIERPIVVAGKKAALGRPPEAVLEIL